MMMQIKNKWKSIKEWEKTSQNSFAKELKEKNEVEENYFN